MFSPLIQKRKIFQVTVLGEMDKAESSYEAMCFVTELVEDEFISSDAMSKLRQVNSTLLIIIIAFIKITKLVNNDEPFYLPTSTATHFSSYSPYQFAFYCYYYQ